MSLTKISTDGVKDDAVTAGKIPANAVGASELADNAVDTNAIADQAVTLAKLPHGDGSSDGKFLRANNGADPSFETVSIPSGTTINNNADNRVITGSGTANTLNGESSVVIDANGKLGIGTSSPTLSSSAYQGIHIHQTASGGAKGSQIHLTNDYGGSAAGDGSHISHYNNYLYINNQENGSTYFYNNGSPTVTILANGNFGVATQAPTKKLDVNGDIKASSIYLGGTGTANQLQDYEEGTWTPTINNGFSPTYSVQSGSYTKIGDMVYFNCYMQYSANSGSNSQGTYGVLNGLPFTSTYNTNILGYAATVPWQYELGQTVEYAYVDQNSTLIQLLLEPSGGDRRHTTASSLWDGGDTRIAVSGWYKTNL